MKFRKLQFLSLMSLLLAIQAHAQINPVLEQRFRDTLLYMQSHYEVRGLSAAVSIKNQGLWKGTAGTSAPGIPLQSDMLIGIGSNTKTFVSTLMLQLYENGQVHLEDSIGTWLSGYPDIDGSITIKQILNHKSGIFSFTENSALWDSLMTNPSRAYTKQEILQYFVKSPAFAPGTSWEYSNTNYIIAGIILEAVTGQQLPQLIRDSILVPLQLNHTFFPPYEYPTFPMAGYWGEGGQYILPLTTYSIPNASGALISTAEDVVHFWEGLFNGALISKATIRNKMLDLAIISPSGNYGYGLGIYKDTYFGNNGYSHGGTWIGQINSNFIDTVRGITICVLSNQDSLRNEYTDAVVAALYKVMLDHTTSIPGVAENEMDIAFYPNPASGVLNLKDDQLEAKTVSLIAPDGKIILKKYFHNGEKTILDISKVLPGLYMGLVENEKGETGRQKVVVRE
jgi:D-alanyl-D-alanine carboxypeptidase